MSTAERGRYTGNCGIDNQLEMDASSGFLADLHAIEPEAMVAGQG